MIGFRDQLRREFGGFNYACKFHAGQEGIFVLDLNDGVVLSACVKINSKCSLWILHLDPDVLKEHVWMMTSIQNFLVTVLKIID